MRKTTEDKKQFNTDLNF